MTRILSDILDTDTVAFNHLIETWEQKTGRSGHDLSLYSDMRRRALAATEALGLDPTDTISAELYFALQERARLDNDWLAERIGVGAHDRPEQMIEKIISWVEKHAFSTTVWVSKPSVCKNLLKKQPPKNVMKALGLRSIDSMLKRYNVAELLILAEELETADWNKKLQLSYKKLRPVDFQDKATQFFIADRTKRTKLVKAQFPVSRVVSANYILGAALVLPASFRYPLDVLATCVAVAEVVFEMRKHSALFRALSVRKDFGVQVSAIAELGIGRATSAISEIGWNSLHRHLVGNEYIMAKIDQPHVTPDDLVAESSLSLLVKHDPRFAYWQHLDYAVFTSPGQTPVSLNLVDVVTNASNRTAYSRGSLTYARTRIWEELWARYLRSDHVVEDVIDSYLHS